MRKPHLFSNLASQAAWNPRATGPHIAPCSLQRAANPRQPDAFA